MLISLIITASQALAANGAPEAGSLGLLAIFFIGFGAMIILFQFIPGIMLMAGMLKGAFSLGRNDTHEVAGNK
jgi:hypothetical protein